MNRHSLGWFSLVTLFALSCKQDDEKEWKAGDSCDPADTEACGAYLVCEPLGDSETSVCGAPVVIRGTVVDAALQVPVAGAHIAAVDETGAPSGRTAVSEEDGSYAIYVAARRDDAGAIVSTLKWQLSAAAANYLSFPRGVRPAIPVDARDAVAVGEDKEIELVIENPVTRIELIAGLQSGSTISGIVHGPEGAGALVVAEADGVGVSSTVADAEGRYTLFNLPAGQYEVRAYRRNTEFDVLTIDLATEAVEGANFQLLNSDATQLASVTGSLNIVNAPGGLATSVVLVPASLYNETLERGPVPLGLRAPEPPLAGNVSSAWMITGVPAGRYRVLTAFENDDLVRDPDASIAGTEIGRAHV